AFYIISRDDLIKSKNRLSGNIRAYEMPEDTAVEIDEPEDFIMIESLMKRRNSRNTVKKPEIKMVLTDCDGCLTDGGMYYSENGDELKKFNTKDGMAFKLLREHGILTGIVTGENVELNRRRVEKLKLDIYEPGCTDKVACIKKICSERNIDINNVLYVGDDINDLGVLEMVGYGCTPADAINEVKKAAKYVTKAKGGEGVIREITDNIIFA
ncbi:MAG: HAD hydrolase family protein, partial [Lachnospiraceae bacterium]|nr:HAD hydrolase family protein [Lachnospiraceae bacterium]